MATDKTLDFTNTPPAFDKLHYFLTDKEFQLVRIFLAAHRPLSTATIYKEAMLESLKQAVDVSKTRSEKQKILAVMGAVLNNTLPEFETSVRSLGIKISYKGIQTSLINLEKLGLISKRASVGTKEKFLWVVTPALLSNYEKFMVKK